MFVSLLTELWRTIWELAFSELVIVQIQAQFHEDQASNVAGGPVLSTNHSSIAETCKKAWWALRKTHHRIDFGANMDPSRQKAVWIGFTRTVFFLGSGRSSYSCAQSLIPRLFFDHIETIALE